VASPGVRVEGELAAADLQLRRDPAGRRRAVRVRHSGRAARGARAGAAARGRRGARHVSDTHLLVVANETVVSPTLIERIEQRVDDATLVTVVAPISDPSAGYVVYADTRRAAARRRLDRTMAALRDAGVHAHGLVVEGDPVDAVRDALDQ